MARLKEQYVSEIAPALNKKFNYKSPMQIPKLDKVIINVAAGEAKENVKVIDAIVKDLGQITGQKAVVCKAKKSVANFKLRQACPSAQRSPCAATVCTSSWIVCSTWLCPAFVTSAASPATLLTDAATTPSA